MRCSFGIRRHLPKVFVILIALFYICIKTLLITPSSQSSLNHQEFIRPTILIKPLQEQNLALEKDEEERIKLVSEKIQGTKPNVRERVSEERCMKKWLGTPPSILNHPDHKKEDEEITCSALLFGNVSDTIYIKAKQYMDMHKRKRPLLDLYFKDSIIDIGCTEFKLSRGYHLNALQEEEEFPIAYNLLIHKDIDQVEMLLRSIYRPQNSYCIHIDAKCNSDVIESVRAIASCFENVFLASRLERIVYAGYSRLQADINCMKDQLKSPIKWKYLLNVAGQEMPLKSNLEMVRILKIYNGANDIEGIYGRRVIRERFEKEWMEVDVDTNHGRLNATGKMNPKPPYDIDIIRGSAYGIFSRNFTEWIINDEKPKALLEWSRKTWSPDEHYWATLHHRYTNPHLNAPGSYSGYPNNHTWLAVWVAWSPENQCYGRWSRSTCIFGIKDLPALVKHPEFMVNKFSVDQEPLAQECIGRWIEYKSDCEPYLDEEFYRQLPFVLKS